MSNVDKLIFLVFVAQTYQNVSKDGYFKIEENKKGIIGLNFNQHFIYFYSLILSHMQRRMSNRLIIWNFINISNMLRSETRYSVAFRGLPSKFQNT